MTKPLKNNHSCCESIQQWAHVCREMMEGDIVGLCDTRRKTCTMTKDEDNALKQKGSMS
jgi:hypothetical protein